MPSGPLSPSQSRTSVFGQVASSSLNPANSSELVEQGDLPVSLIYDQRSEDDLLQPLSMAVQDGDIFHMSSVGIPHQFPRKDLHCGIPSGKSGQEDVYAAFIPRSQAFPPPSTALRKSLTDTS
ncbi:hypothetical protein RB195_013193 [Necator americanus]|uniref:Uncharacterized protein n=1 Tax=Necator americanus TaxID=51031 RepID=A0ABR1DUK4_NECAM